MCEHHENTNASAQGGVPTLGAMGVCPNCGYCPTCGRRYGYPWQPLPLQPWPGYPAPYIGDPIPPFSGTITWGGTNQLTC